MTHDTQPSPLDPAITSNMRNAVNPLPDSETSTQFNINQILPPELLVFILDSLYTDAIASIPLAPAKYPPLDRHPLLNMMLVCRSWRQIIMDTPCFWTTVCIGAGVGPQSVEKGCLEEVLGRSGRLPLMAIIAPELLLNFQVVHDAMRDQFQRLSTLALVVMDKMAATMLELIRPLFQHPLPTLKRLHVGQIRFNSTIYDYGIRRIMIDAPELQELSSERHFIFPKFPSHLTFLSLTAVFNGALDSPLTPGCLEIPLLLDLYISECDPAPFLLAFITPSLRKLVVYNDTPSPSHEPFPPLRAYSKLEELQWADRGPDRTFSTLLRLCPNLTRYSNYLVGHETKVHFHAIDTPATILSLLPDDIEARRASSGWPMLEEIQLDVASCEEISTLIDAIPSIKRVRVLRSFASRKEEEPGETESFSSLRQKVDLAFWLDPWSSSPGENGM
ncbi:hypothetical protein FRC04_002267 [Tulasnella sp. 424]|nr:hypothetical protein FRC04_002267 [Tulasnella sp. 424]KAG8977341.1 hypothetical protein FRC05_001739 [Tulasnella sp. 425]